MTKIIKKDIVDGKLMNDNFNIYYIEARNQVLFKGKGEYNKKDFLISLDSLSVAE